MIEFENKSKSEVVFIRITKEMNDQLIKLSHENKVSKSEVIRTLLKDSFKRMGG